MALASCPPGACAPTMCATSASHQVKVQQRLVHDIQGALRRSAVLGRGGRCVGSRLRSRSPGSSLLHLLFCPPAQCRVQRGRLK